MFKTNVEYNVECRVLSVEYNVECRVCKFH